MEKSISDHRSAYQTPAMRSYRAWYKRIYGKDISPAEVIKEQELRTAKKDLKSRRASLSKLTDIRCRRARLERIAKRQ